MPDKIKSAVDAISAGRMVIVVDDKNREGEGDFVMAAEKVRADDVNFMAVYGKGLICAPLAVEHIERLDLKPMVESNECAFGTNFTVSVDYKEGLTTGISMYERAATIRALSDFSKKSNDFVRPGHVFPLAAQKGGVLERAGHTEAAVDLVRLAGLSPAGVICEIIRDDGHMARMDELLLMADKFGMEQLHIEDLIKYLR